MFLSNTSVVFQTSFIFLQRTMEYGSLFRIILHDMDTFWAVSLDVQPWFSLQVCQDFLRGKCERDACRYLHPPDHLRSRIRDVRLTTLHHLVDCPRWKYFMMSLPDFSQPGFGLMLVCMSKTTDFCWSHSFGSRALRSGALWRSFK